MAGGYDVGSYQPGDHHEAFNADGPVVESAAPAPAPSAGEAPAAPAPAPAASKTDSDRYAWMKAEAAKRAAAASTQPKETPKEEAAVEEPAVEEAPQPVESFELQVPSFVDAREITPERQGYVTAFQALAPEVGIDAAAAQGLLDVAVDAAVALDYTSDPAASSDDARATMIRFFGDENAKNLIANAQRYAQARGESFLKYLDTTGLGNDPSVIVSLAFAGSTYLTQSPAQAKEGIAKLMASKEYQAGDKLAMVKLHALSRIANRDAVDPLAVAVKQTPMSREREAAMKSATQSDGEIRSELSKLLDPRGPLLSGGPEQAAHKVRYFELLAKLS
jgi:hypothetical protein